MTTPAGWYPDPGQSGNQRYFDGASWTDNYAPYAAPPPPSAAPWPAGPPSTPTVFVPTGEPINNRKTVVRVIAVLAVLALLAVGWNLVTDEESGITARSDGSLNETVVDGEFAFMVTNVYESGPIGSNVARGTYIVVAMTVTNSGSEPQSFFAQNQKLIDSFGREYAADTMATFSVNNDSSIDSTMVMNMNPGFRLTTRIPFDVPPGTVADKVEVHDSAFSAGAVVNLR